MPPCMIQVEGKLRWAASFLTRRPRQLFFPRDTLAVARLETDLPAVRAFGFDEKTRSQPETNFSDVPV